LPRTSAPRLPRSIPSGRKMRHMASGPMQRRTAALSVQPGGEIPRKTGQRPTSASASPDQVCLTLMSRRWPNAQAHIRWASIAGAPLLELFKHVQFWPAAPMAKSDRHSTDLHLARNCASGPWIFVPDTCGTKPENTPMRTRLFWFPDFCWPQRFPSINSGVGPACEAGLRGAALRGRAAKGAAREADLEGSMPAPLSDAV